MVKMSWYLSLCTVHWCKKWGNDYMNHRQLWKGEQERTSGSWMGRWMAPLNVMFNPNACPYWKVRVENPGVLGNQLQEGFNLDKRNREKCTTLVWGCTFAYKTFVEKVQKLEEEKEDPENKSNAWKNSNDLLREPLRTAHQDCDIEQKNAQRAVVELACLKVVVAAKWKGLHSWSQRSLQLCAPDWDLEHWDRDIWSSFFSSSSNDKGGWLLLYRRGEPPS